MSIDSDDDLQALCRVGQLVGVAAHFEETIVITRGAPIVLTALSA